MKKSSRRGGGSHARQLRASFWRHFGIRRLKQVRRCRPLSKGGPRESPFCSFFISQKVLLCLSRVHLLPMRCPQMTHKFLKCIMFICTQPHGMVWYGFLVTKHKRVIKIIKGTREGIQQIVYGMAGYFNLFGFQRPAGHIIRQFQPEPGEKGAIRSDLGQTKACARPPVKKGRTAAPGPKTHRPIRDSENSPERDYPSTTEVQLSGESALFKLASIS